MARCQCAGTQCSCAITAGDNVSIEGSGARTDPYVITAANVGDSLLVDNTGHNVTLHTLGDGTPTNPMTLSADAYLRMADLTDVVDAPAPTNGQVPTWNGSAYAPATPAVPTPLTVTDTPTLDLTLTAGNVLSGVPTLKMADLTDVVDAPAPTLGQVPVWNGSAYAPATPAVGTTKKYAAALTGTSSPETVTHNLGTQDVFVAVYASSSPFQMVDVDWAPDTVNTVKITYVPNLGAGYRVVVIG